MNDKNPFRILADSSHIISKIVLIYAIHRNRSAEGVSLLTQILYLVVFSTRYLDLFRHSSWEPEQSYNTPIKIFYLISSAYIVFLMMGVFARTREKEYAWKLALWALGGAVLGAPVVSALFRKWAYFTPFEVIWTFSIILESFCVLPQLLLLRQTSVPTVINSFYLVTLGLYRALYIPNWIWKSLGSGTFDPISAVFGIIQTALYIDFAWVYYSRQRVKLRAGGIIDSDDLNRGLFMKRLIGRRKPANAAGDGEEEGEDLLAQQENGAVGPRSARTWGGRGISVRADDTLLEHDAESARAFRDAPIVDPADFDMGDDDEEDADAPLPELPKDGSKSVAVEREEEPHEVGSSANEWRENTGGS